MAYDFSRVTAYLQEVHGRLGAPCCDAIVYFRGRQVYRYMTGVARRDENRPVSADTLYFLYSCTKPVTAAAAMQLVERGVWRLEDPLSRYLPEFSEMTVETEGKRVPARPITLRHLLTMSAGFHYTLRSPQITARRERFGCAATTRQMIGAYAEMPLGFQPGERYEYSVCMDVLAAALEAASGMRFGEYLRKNIFDPLGMEEIGFTPTPEQQSRIADQYRSEGIGVLREVGRTVGDFRLSENFESGGAGLFARLEDYGKFAAAMSCGGTLPDGGRILRPETVAQMAVPQIGRFVIDPRFGCAAGPGYSYGLGVRTLTEPSGGQRSAVGEMGWDGAGGAYILMEPARQVAIVYAQHTLNWPAGFYNVHGPLRDAAYEALGF